MTNSMQISCIIEYISRDDIDFLTWKQWRPRSCLRGLTIRLCLYDLDSRKYKRMVVNINIRIERSIHHVYRGLVFMRGGNSCYAGINKLATFYDNFFVFVGFFSRDNFFYVDLLLVRVY